MKTLKEKLDEYRIFGDYEVRFMDYDEFVEIKDKKRIVGFLSFKKYNEKAYALSDAYITEKSRGKYLMLKEFIKLLINDVEISIREPSRDFVDILIHYKFASKVNESLVVSSLSFDIENIEYSQEFELDDICSTFLYDLNLSSPVYIEDITGDKCEIAYQKLLKSDEEYSRNFRDNMNLDEYFKDFKKYFKKNAEAFAKILFKLKNDLPHKEDEKQDDEIDKLIKNALDAGKITGDKAEDIKDKLRREYKSGNVSEKGLGKYLDYLSKDSLQLPNELPDRACPNCYHKITPKQKMCSYCGWDISNGKFLNEDEVMEEVLKVHFKDFVESRLEEEKEKRFRSLKDKVDSDFEDETAEKLPIKNTDIYYFKHETYIKDGEYALIEGSEINQNAKTTFNTHKVLSRLKENPNIYDALDGEGIDDYSIVHELMMTELIESKDLGERIYDVMDDMYTEEELRKISKKCGLSDDGGKNRLRYQLIDKGFYNEFGITDFVLTDRGKAIIKYTSWIDFYTEHLNIYNFNDFTNYIGAKKSQTFDPHCEMYLNEHLKEAYENHEFERIYDALVSRSISNVYFENYVACLNDELQIFILNINPVYLDDLDSYTFLEKTNIKNIEVMSEVTRKKNLKKVFNKNWDKVEIEKVISKKTALKYLNEAVKSKDLESLEDKIKKEFLKSL